MKDLIKLFKQKYDSKELSPYDNLLSLLDSCISILENENASYRPVSKKKKAGGLLDFTSKDSCNLPVIVVPDLHGREKFLLDIMQYRFSEDSSFFRAGTPSFEACSGKTVLECLEQGLIYVICVGDIFHSESRGKFRWVQAFEEYSHGNYVNSFMKMEMKENISLLEMLLILKSAFAGHFHILKGNHENVLNEMSVKPYGNVPFRKFCDEGNMVADFLQAWYDDLILHEINCFEKALPVCAVFSNCVISHAEPAKKYTKNQIINYHSADSDVVFGLTWTANDKAELQSVEKTMKSLLPENYKHAVWIGGHRPVIGSYAARQDGNFIQIHNPEEENIAIIVPEKKFNPVKQIVNVEV